MLATDNINLFNLPKLKFPHWQSAGDNTFLSTSLEELKELHEVEAPSHSATLERCLELGLGLELSSVLRGLGSNPAETPSPCLIEPQDPLCRRGSSDISKVKLKD